jgi:hypothetical protein
MEAQGIVRPATRPPPSLQELEPPSLQRNAHLLDALLEERQER